MNIVIKNVSVEAHHFIRLVKCYHGPLCRIYSIIILKIPRISYELALQILFKALNDFVDLNGLVSTLLIFGAYSQMAEMDALLLTIT